MEESSKQDMPNRAQYPRRSERSPDIGEWRTKNLKEALSELNLRSIYGLAAILVSVLGFAFYLGTVAHRTGLAGAKPSHENQYPSIAGVYKSLERVQEYPADTFCPTQLSSAIVVFQDDNRVTIREFSFNAMFKTNRMNGQRPWCGRGVRDVQIGSFVSDWEWTGVFVQDLNSFDLTGHVIDRRGLDDCLACPSLTPEERTMLASAITDTREKFQHGVGKCTYVFSPNAEPKLTLSLRYLPFDEVASGEDVRTAEYVRIYEFGLGCEPLESR